MLFDLKEVFVTDGASASLNYELDLSSVELDGIYPFTSPVVVSAAAQNTAGIVTLTLHVEFDYSRPCDRCFDELTRRLTYTFSHKLIESIEGEDNDDYIETPDFNLELDELITSDILLELPSKFLCKQDCQGLCQKCGHNLNLGDCDCDKRQIDPRLEALKQLLD